VTEAVTPDSASAVRPPAKRRQSGVVIPNQPKWHQRILAFVIFCVERAISATLRIKWDDRAGLKSGALHGPVIFCLWHNRLALCTCVWRNYIRRHMPKHGLAALISASKDGALLAAILEQFGIQPVRGSSSRRGAQALIELTSSLERGSHLAITPDGPRGPCYQVQPGVIALAQVTGAPVIPASSRTHWKFCLRSWDKFQIPLPFSRCDVTFGEPIFIPRDATDAQREEALKKLEAALRAITHD
jgi:lysophospholipid acyltransferase (LPLAT)-like uncharacterized protein